MPMCTSFLGVRATVYGASSGRAERTRRMRRRLRSPQSYALRSAKVLALSMELHADARIPFPRDRVFTAYRDHLPDLLPYLPNVKRVEVKSREEKGHIVNLVNEWQGGGEIPAAVRAIIGDSMMGW